MALINQSARAYYGSSQNYGNYQFTTLENIINQFMVGYVGDGKEIRHAKKTEVAFHAQRALQEFSFDTLVSSKIIELTIPNSLVLVIPQDYVSYSKISWSDSAGIEHVIYPTSKTSNPISPIQSDDNTGFIFNSQSQLTFDDDSSTWDKYKSNIPSENNSDDYEDDTYWPSEGKRYGLDPQHAQVNGSFYIDQARGKIHFSSNLSGKTVIIRYISDGLGTDQEMIVHKFAEEAMYKSIAYAILSSSVNIRRDVVERYRKERFASIRKAKLRLSKINIEEIAQILRGKSKQIKH